MYEIKQEVTTRKPGAFISPAIEPDNAHTLFLPSADDVFDLITSQNMKESESENYLSCEAATYVQRVANTKKKLIAHFVPLFTGVYKCMPTSIYTALKKMLDSSQQNLFASKCVLFQLREIVLKYNGQRPAETLKAIYQKEELFQFMPSFYRSFIDSINAGKHKGIEEGKRAVYIERLNQEIDAFEGRRDPVLRKKRQDKTKQLF